MRERKGYDGFTMHFFGPLEKCAAFLRDLDDIPGVSGSVKTDLRPPVSTEDADANMRLDEASVFVRDRQGTTFEDGKELMDTVYRLAMHHEIA